MNMSETVKQRKGKDRGNFKRVCVCFPKHHPHSRAGLWSKHNGACAAGEGDERRGTRDEGVAGKERREGRRRWPRL